MKHKAVFFDRDGVINREIGEYVYSLDKFQMNEMVFESMRLLQDAAFKLFIVSNQGGIAKKLYTKKDVDCLHDMLSKQLEKAGIFLSGISYCPHHDDIEKCLCRKPSGLMLQRIIASYDIDPGVSYMIGDSPRDVQAAENAGVKGIQIPPNTSVFRICKQIAEGKI